MIAGVVWRVFSAQGHDKHVVVHVAEQDQARQDVVLASMRSVIWPVAVALPFLGFGVWAAIRQALKPLSALGYEVAHRKPDASEPLPDAGVPREVLPLVDALNRLFGRIAMLIDSERRFTADAAHELRTPLAGIRMQAQVARVPTMRSSATMRWPPPSRVVTAPPDLWTSCCNWPGWKARLM